MPRQGVEVSSIDRPDDMTLSFSLSSNSASMLKTPVHLSYLQERYWLLNELNPNAASANYQRAWVVSRTTLIDTAALQKALNKSCQRHPVLKTVFARDNLELVAVPGSSPLVVRSVNLRSKNPESQQQALAELGAEEYASRFNLATGPLIKLLVVDLAPEKWALIITAHAAMMDLRSFDLLVNEIFESIYHGHDDSNSPAPSTPAFHDFVVWQRSLSESGALDDLLKDHMERLGSSASPLELRLDHQRPAIQSYRVERESIHLDEGLRQDLEDLAARTASERLDIILFSLFAALLYRYAGQDELTIGIPYDYRIPLDVPGMIGPLENTLSIRLDLTSNPTFLELVSQAAGQWQHACIGGMYPYEQLIDKIQPERDLSTNPLQSTHFAFIESHNNSQPANSDSEVLWEKRPGQYDLSITASADRGGIDLHLDYSPDILCKETAERILRHYEEMARSIQRDASVQLSQISMLTNAERHQILDEWNNSTVLFPDRDACIHEIFEKQAATTPEAIAVIQPPANGLPRQELSYEALNQRANQLAHLLIQHGAGPETIVGISIERSIDMIIGLLGILKSGAAYLPLDPYYPADRLEFMIQDSGVKLIITKEHLAQDLPVHEEHTTICIDGDQADINRMPAHNPDSGVSPQNLAYIIYTSGSTGQPKGVELMHASVVNHNLAVAELFNLAPADRVLQFSTINFDAAVEEIFPALQRGCTLVLRPAAPPDAEVDVISGSQLLDLIQAESLTVLDMATAYWNEWVNELVLKNTRVPASVRLVAIGGEKASADQVINWLNFGGDRVTWLNTYGPTETTVISSWFELPPGSTWDNAREIPIGKPLANNRLYILDRHLQLVPVGVPGELYIGGDVLARGYLKRPELTKERFIPDPYRSEPGARMYKTGDLVRWLPDGNIEFLGRVDFQIKIRGFRVELGEIETQLDNHPDVLQVVVLARPSNSKTGSTSDLRLVAYVVPKKNDLGIYSVTSASLRSYLEESLPHYMIPSAIVFLEAMPLTRGGKVDRRALPEPGQTQSEDQREHVPPRTEVETQLVRIWEEFLETRPIGIRDNFFDLGGHSLMALRLFGRIEKELGANLPLAALLQTPTIEYLAQLIDYKYDSSAWSPLVPIQPLGSKPPFFGVHGLDGNVLFWRALTRYLGTDQPFYGLQARGVDGLLDALDSFPQMAEMYIHEIRKIQPHGPYFLGGFSMGGEIIFEMAHQLLADGEKVALLVMFDTPNPARPIRLLHPTTEENEAAVIQDSGNRVFAKLKDYWTRIQYHWDILSSYEWKDRPAYLANDLRNRFTRLYLRLMIPNYRRRQKRLPDWMLLAHMQQRHYKANQYYLPMPYPGKITLFRASESLETSPFDHPMGWKHLAKEVEYHIFDSTHRIVDDEFAEIVGAQLQESLSRSRGEK